MKRVIVGASGASGMPILLECLAQLRRVGCQTHLILSRHARPTLQAECGLAPQQLQALADVCYDPEDIAAAPASGTWRADGMLVVPCSMKAVAGICAGYSDDLLLRAADVTLKEGRPLVLAARETPLSAIHLRNLAQLACVPGVRIVPPMLSYYQVPRTVEDMTRHAAEKLLAALGIETEDRYQWNGL